MSKKKVQNWIRFVKLTKWLQAIAGRWDERQMPFVCTSVPALVVPGSGSHLGPRSHPPGRN